MQSYRDELFRFVLRRVDDEASAEDIVQDVLLKAHDRRESLADPSKLRPWLYRITRNAIADHYRALKPSLPVPDNLPESDAGDGVAAGLELAGCLRPLLGGLPEAYREAVELVDFEGIAQREAATRLGLSLSGAKSRVQRGRRMLRDAVLACCRVELDRRGGVVDFERREETDSCDVPGCD